MVYVKRIYTPRTTVKSGKRFFQISFHPSNERDLFDAASEVVVREGNWETNPDKDIYFTYNRRRFKSGDSVVKKIQKDFGLTDIEASTIKEAMKYALEAKSNGGGKWRKFTV